MTLKNHYFVERPKSKLKLGMLRVQLRGKTFEFLTASSVFSKKRIDPGTRLLIESMILPEKGTVLDLGCGYGAVGIAAAALNPNVKVIMVDLNARAVWLTKKNIKINNVENAEVKQGYIYSPVEKLTFNCILSNPPLSAGMQTVKKIITEAPKHMKTKALFQLVVKSKIGGKRLCTILEETFGKTEILARKSGYRVFLSQKQS